MLSWHPSDSDSGMVQDDESSIKVHNDANACFFWIPLDYRVFEGIYPLYRLDIDIWATVKLGDTLALFVKSCRSCRNNSTTTFIFGMLQPYTLF